VGAGTTGSGANPSDAGTGNACAVGDSSCNP
jgi:hypothetical protein